MTAISDSIRNEACSPSVYTKDAACGVKMAQAAWAGPGSARLYEVQYRLNLVQQRLGLDRDKAFEYLAAFEADGQPICRLDDYIEYVMPHLGSADRLAPTDRAAAKSSITPVIASAEAFRLAIDALPVGRDIRNRLLGHLDAHIATIRAIGAAS